MSDIPAQEAKVSAEDTSEKVFGKESPAEDIISQHGENSVDGDEPQPKLHAKTFLAVFAVCLIYFAQDFALVGAGAVSSDFVHKLSSPFECQFLISK
jgi:hypothetical protein